MDKRRREFETGRTCARAALGRLGRPSAPLLPGRHGEPRWPEGIVGSITHTRGYRGVGVSEAAHAAAIGIDAEPNQPVPGPLLHWVATPDERAEVDALLRASPGVRFDRLLLCAKEAVFKSWFTLTTRRLGFEDVAIELEPAPGSGTFTARLEDAHDRRARLRGRWLLAEGLLITAVVIAVEPSPPSAERLSSRALRH